MRVSRISILNDLASIHKCQKSNVCEGRSAPRRFADRSNTEQTRAAFTKAASEQLLQ